ncbi:unnamed protein product [Orchesella dallaii]|uniref:Kinesin motor domain-containing protein n=1 Tax=Orchesella dallaii TaxID=48710 RepID=A0ABP1Q802_9HEXA
MDRTSSTSYRKEESDGRSKRIIRMDELSSTVGITNPDNPSDIHKFTFDNLFWSFDGYSEQADGYFAQENRTVSEEIYCDQKQVYDEIGKEIVQNLWNGYNSTVFTFGESKSGKSWTLLGLGANKGFLPQTLTDLFKCVREKEKGFQQNGFSAEVRFTMAEIYNDRVKDLLPSSASSSTKYKNVAKIREHSKKGFYVEGLRPVLIVNHEDIQHRLEEGLINRATFLTSINATSANSMTVIAITLVQKSRNHRGDEVTRMATLEFMDLPACDVLSSERESDESMDFICLSNPNIKANGIDKLSLCVDKLLEESIGKHSGAVPFHYHGISKLLKNALTGNSRTYMIVTLSPSETSFKNSLFALQFAEKVRMLNTSSAINEEVTSKLIRELKGESDRLKKLITLGEFEQCNYFTTQAGELLLLSPLEREAFKRRVTEDMKAQIKENEKEIRNLQQPYEERLKAFKIEKNDLGKKQENDRKNKCHIFNLNGDSQISGKIIHIIPLGTIDFGQVNKGKENHFLVLCGPGIRDVHGTFTYNSKDGKISIKPAGPNCKILVNEMLIQFDTILTNNDRISFGGNQIWVYQNPKETWLEKYAFSYKLHYEYVSEELALKSECYRNLCQTGPPSDELQKELICLIPAIEDATAISEDLGQNFTMKPLILQPIDMLLRESNTEDSDKSSYYESFKSIKSSEILIKVQNSVDGTFYYWTTNKFYEQLEMLKESYMQFVEDNEIPLKEVQAFKERSDMDMPIGYSIICLKPLAYLVNINTTAPILDYITFQQIGSINVSLSICDDETGENMNDVEVFIESPDELIDDNLTAILCIQSPDKICLHYKEVYCKYKFLEEEEMISTKLDIRPPNFIGISNKYEKKFSIHMITENTLNLILTQYLILRFYGKQKAHKLLNLMGTVSNTAFDPGRSANPFEQERINAQLKLKEKVEQRHQRRLNAMKALVDQSETLGEESIPVTVVKSLFQAKSQKQVDQSLEEHKESLTVVPEEEPVEEKQLAPELKALKRFSEVCSIV